MGGLERSGRSAKRCVSASPRKGPERGDMPGTACSPHPTWNCETFRQLALHRRGKRFSAAEFLSVNEGFEKILAESDWARRLARRLVGADADDLLSESSLAALRNPPRDGSRFRAWTGVVMRRLAARRRRRGYLAAVAETRAARTEAIDPATDATDRIDLHQKLADAVRRLPETARTAIVQIYFRGLTHAEAARESGITEGAHRTRTARAVDRLRADFVDDCGSEKSAYAGLLALAGVSPGETTKVLIGVSIVAKKSSAALAALVLAVALGSTLWWLARSSEDDEWGARDRRSAVSSDASAAARRRSDRPSSAPAPSTPTASRPTRSVRLSIVDGRDQPVPRAEFIAFTSDGIEMESATDDRGCAEFAMSAPSAEIYVRADGHEVRRFPLAEAPEIKIVLPDDEELSGKVIVDGGTPPAGFSLRLRAIIAPAATIDLPPTVAERVREKWGDPIERRIAPDVEGQFVFRGLARHWWGSIAPSKRYRFDRGSFDPEPTLSVRRPTRGLELVLFRSTEFHGVVVDADTGAPVQNRGLTIEISDARSQGFQIRPVSPTDAEGRFRADLPRPGPFIVRVDVDGVAGADAQFFRGLVGSSIDLGVLRVRTPPSRSLRLRVVDEYDRGIAGAIVDIRTDMQDLSASTDAAGFIDIPSIAPDVRRINVAAPGYRSTSFPLPDGKEGTVRLKSTPLVVFRVKDASGRPVEGIAVAAGRVVPEEDVAPTGRPNPSEPGFDPRDRATKKAWSTAALNFPYGRYAEIIVMTDPDGIARFGHLSPGTTIEAMAIDEIGGALAEPVSFVAPATGTLEFDVTVTADIRRIFGTVRDEEGSPIAGASVRLCDLGRPFASGLTVVTDAFGKFSFRARTARASLSVTSVHFLDRNFGPFDFKESENRFDLTLDPRPSARDVFLEIRDADRKQIGGDGASWIDRGITVFASGPGVEGARTAAGDLVFHAMPRQRMTIELTIDGAEYYVKVAPDEDRIVFTLPPTGKAVVRVVAIPPRAAMIEIKIAPTGNTSGSARRRVLPVDGLIGTPVEFTDLLPGSYEVSLAKLDSDTSSTDFSPIEGHRPRSIKVAVRQTTEIEIE